MQVIFKFKKIIIVKSFIKFKLRSYMFDDICQDTVRSNDGLAMLDGLRRGSRAKKPNSKVSGPDWVQALPCADESPAV